MSMVLTAGVLGGCTGVVASEVRPSASPEPRPSPMTPDVRDMNPGHLLPPFRPRSGITPGVPESWRVERPGRERERVTHEGGESWAARRKGIERDLLLVVLLTGVVVVGASAVARARFS